MKKTDPLYAQYVSILKEELVPAMGCTEPIAIAYASAVCRETLGSMPEEVSLCVSSCIIKNCKSVVVPNTNGRRGMEAAVAIGTVAGDASAKMQVIANPGPDSEERIASFLSSVSVDIQQADNGLLFFIGVYMKNASSSASVTIENFHTNITEIRRNGMALFSGSSSCETAKTEVHTDRSVLTIDGIWDFVQSVDLADVQDVIRRQISFNSALSEEGFRNPWGAQIGRILLEESNGDIRMKARAAAAAGSDARMSGCELPAIILSGSGNQGITATMPVLVYAEHLKSSEDQIIRALILSDLVTVHQKEGIGSVSAFCGATCAGIGAGSGIAYLNGGDKDTICHTIVNALAIVSGMICDGAKPSCAAKISAAVDAGMLGYCMYTHGQQFYGGDGIVKKGVENSINSMCEIAREGMRETNERILGIMMKD